MMEVTMIGYTRFVEEDASDTTHEVWMSEGSGAQDLAEFAGRACYQSWHRPNPKTSDNESYLKHILDVGHGSVLEHGSVTFYIRGVSRSLTHELVRHRVGVGYSQLSQRFVMLGREGEGGFVMPPLFADDGVAGEILQQAWTNATVAYDQLLERGMELAVSEGLIGTAARKAAAEAARAVLPNMTPTAIVMTGNHRAWRELLMKRGSMAADREIRALAINLFLKLERLEPNIYQDITPVLPGRDRKGHDGNHLRFTKDMAEVDNEWTDKHGDVGVSDE